MKIEFRLKFRVSEGVSIKMNRANAGHCARLSLYCVILCHLSLILDLQLKILSLMNLTAAEHFGGKLSFKTQLKIEKASYEFTKKR